ncbi:MAG: TerB family tellurite resistance protein, partial [Methyloceanibacter sp.]
MSKLSELFERVGDSESRLRGWREEEWRVAAAALLVNASVIDGEVAPEERRKLKALLRERFDLSDDECR